MIGCLLIPPAPDATVRALRLRLERLSPRVQAGPAERAAALLLDLGRGTAAEGRRRAEELLAAAADVGQAGRAGVAPAPTLARLAAALAAPGAPVVLPPGAVGAALARCPVGWLAPLAPMAPAMARLGLRSLGDLAALPAAAVSGRFGPATLAAWRTLHGDEPPLAPTPAPPRLLARRTFAGPVARRAELELAAGRLAARLAARLEGRGLAARGLALRLHADWGHPLVAGRTLERPASTAATLAPAAAALVAAALPAAPGAEHGPAICALELVAGELVAPRGEQLGLFGPAPGARAEALAALDDLAARLGPGCLLRAAPRPGAPPQLVPWGAP